MKTAIRILFLMFFGISTAQNSTRVFSFSPMKNSVNQVDGMVLGIGHFDANPSVINGLNIEVNPFILLYPLIPKAIEIPTKENATVRVNGIHLSTGGFTDARALNGIGISGYHHSVETNGFSVNFFNNTSGKLNGIHLSGFANASEKSNGIILSVGANDLGQINGISVSLQNYSTNLKGLQIGIYNKSEQVTGIQIGLFNKTKILKGVQLGFWNVNQKRSLPFINF